MPSIISDRDAGGNSGVTRPGLLGLHDPTYQPALSLPEQSFWGREREAEPEPSDD